MLTLIGKPFYVIELKSSGKFFCPTNKGARWEDDPRHEDVLKFESVDHGFQLVPFLLFQLPEINNLAIVEMKPQLNMTRIKSRCRADNNS